MPFVGIHSWRQHYFNRVTAPADVVIPLNDSSAFELYPAERWVYNKLLICETQQIGSGLHGIDPLTYPVFVKPVYNLRNFGTDSSLIESSAQFLSIMRPGLMWMEFFEGEHISSDLIVIMGKIFWRAHTLGVPAGKGTFDYWEVSIEVPQELEEYLSEWVARCLPEFIGVVNLETIGGNIIEVHLRMGSQYLDLYGEGWLAHVVKLYSLQYWDGDNNCHAGGFSLPVNIPHGASYVLQPDRIISLAADYNHILSLQFPTGDTDAPEKFQSPPGGKIVGFINGTELTSAKELRQQIIQECLNASAC